MARQTGRNEKHMHTYAYGMMWNCLEKGYSYKIRIYCIGDKFYRTLPLNMSTWCVVWRSNDADSYLRYISVSLYLDMK